MVYGGLWLDQMLIDNQTMNIKTVFVGDSAPTITYSGMVWSNTQDNNLYKRDSANANWLLIPNGSNVGNVYTNFEVTDLLTLDKLTNIKDSGDVIEQVEGSGVVTNVANPSGAYGTLFCTVISPNDHVTVLTDPMLTWNQALLIEKDIQGHGFLGTSSDPYKGYGGGAVMMGVGFTGLYCPSMFVLTGTMLIPSDPLGSYPSGTSFPTPINAQFFYRTDLKALYQYLSGSWVLQYSNVQSGNFDTLFLIEADNNAPANLYLNNLTAMNNIYLNKSLYFDGSGDIILYENTALGHKVLELQGYGMIIDGYLNVGGISTASIAITLGGNGEPLLTLVDNTSGNPKILFNTDCDLYRRVVSGVTVLETDNGFICDNLNTGGISCNLVVINGTSEPALTLSDSNAKILFYNDVNLYRTVKATLPVLETDYGFIAPYINTTAISLNATTGTAPLSVVSTTLVSNLNADLIDGHHWSDIPSQYITSVSSPLGVTTGNLAIDLTLIQPRDVYGNVTIGGTFYADNDIILNNNSTYKQSIHQIVETVNGVTAGVVQILNQNGDLSTLDCAFLFTDHMKSASGAGITIFDNVTLQRLGTTSPTITGRVGSYYCQNWYKNSSVGNIVVHFTAHSTAVNSGFAAYLSSTNGSGTLLQSCLSTGASGDIPLTFVVPVNYWYYIGFTGGSNSGNTTIDCWTEVGI